MVDAAPAGAALAPETEDDDDGAAVVAAGVDVGRVDVLIAVVERTDAVLCR